MLFGSIVLEVVERVMGLDPRLHYNTIVVLDGGLQEFLDSRCNLLGQEVLKIPLVVQG
jgi:hypothetical protein